MIKDWIEKAFSSEHLSNEQIIKALESLKDSKESADLSGTPEFLYELAKVHSEAAFIWWQMQKQTKLSHWLGKNDNHISIGLLFPKLGQKSVLILKEGKVYSKVVFKKIEKPLAYRKLEWCEVENLGIESSTYNQSELETLLKNEVLFTAAIIAGAKFKSYQLALDYASKRIQGGRVIKDWSSVQNILNELYLSIKTDESLMKDLNLPTALNILKDADHFVSQNMQVLGGAGYIEDYVVERLYRECIFLKNWPKPFKEELIRLLK